MSRSYTVEMDAGEVSERSSASKLRVARFLSSVIFVTLLCLIVLTAIPYGTSQPWWEAFFVCAVFTLAILWLLESLISDKWLADSWPLALPLVVLAIFSFLQTLPFGNQSLSPAGINFTSWNAVSADPYQTRFFVLRLLALTVAGMLLFRYVATERRMRIIINVIVGVAVASAFFGILRQTTQRTLGFGLPLLDLGSGYAQFINYNHFAYLMEMALGLILGLVLGGGIKRDQSLIYVAVVIPIWTALVLCGSRGGLIAMLAQLIVTVLLFSRVSGKRKSSASQSTIVRTANSLPMRLALIVVLLGGVVFGTLWLGGDRLASKIESTRSELSADTSEQRLGVSRNDIWKATWQMFVRHPILGVGMGGYWAAIPTFHNASGIMTPQEAHNDYLELLASGGLIGLGLGIWFAVIVLKRTRENLRSPNRFRRAACYGAAIGIAGVAVHSLVDFGLHTIVNALVLTTLIVIATSKPRWGNERIRTYE